MKKILKQTAKAVINFEDGSEKLLDLGAECTQINLPADRPQSMSIHQNKSGEWNFAFTAPLFEGKKFKSITITKNEPGSKASDSCSQGP